jgi:hypothetical protein
MACGRVGAFLLSRSRAREQIEYVDEEPWVREKFQEKLSKRGLTSLMPEEAYRNRDYEWAYKLRGQA